MYEQKDKMTISPSSFFSVPPPAVAERIRKQPECCLLWAVLENAVDTYMKHVTATGRRGRRLFLEAEDWFVGGPDMAFSFVSICHILELIQTIYGEGRLA
jgi:hypothetical protein